MKEVRKILRKSLGALGSGEETKEEGKGVTLGEWGGDKGRRKRSQEAKS